MLKNPLGIPCMSLPNVTRIRGWGSVSRVGYVSDTDTRPIRICGVSDFLLISQFLSTPVDTYLYLGYGPAQQKQCLPVSPDALAPNTRTSCGRAASSEHAQGSLVPAHRSPATSLRPPLTRDEPPSPRTASCVHVRHLLRRGCATARRPPSPSLWPLHAILLLQIRARKLSTLILHVHPLPYSWSTLLLQFLLNFVCSPLPLPDFCPFLIASLLACNRWSLQIW